MSDLKKAFEEGRGRAKIKSRRQAIVRGILDGTLLAFLIWGPFRFWERLLIVVFVRFVYGMIACSARGGNMSLFGPAKIRITPSEFATTQLDYLFSAEFLAREREQFVSLSNTVQALRGVGINTYLKEKQNVVYNLLQLAWDRTVPYSIFIEYSSIMSDDPRVKAANFGAYDRCLSRAQEAGVDTFGFIAFVFLSQVLPKDADIHDDEMSKLLLVYGTEFTSLYISYEKLVKRHKFVTSR
jgi:hypothetical protein